MKAFLIVSILILAITQHSIGNNVQVSNVRLTGQNTTEDFTMVEFDITWENSWRYANGPANWDAAWVFVKYKLGHIDEWKHARLNNSGHQICGATTFENGLLNLEEPFSPMDNPVLGIFLYRSSAGSGTFSCNNVQLRWNYGTNGVPDNEVIDVQVFAIECVYVPQGSFQVGTIEGNELYTFYTYPNDQSSYYITGENISIPVGPIPSYLYYSATSLTFGGDQTGPVPAQFPKGFKAFYAMKYEISQKAYVDFLNTLSRNQQISRVASDISGSGSNFKFVMSGNTSPIHRNGISCRTILGTPPAAVYFFCDLNNNTMGNESSDGLSVACNFLSYGDIAAYLDWAALRLMTEFEFEKCARGPGYTYPNEYAWGTSAVILHQSTVVNLGTDYESTSDPYANLMISLDGPARCGIFAKSATNRFFSGAGFYGCMDLSGNVWERVVTIGNPEGRSYTGIHGDGDISQTGELSVDFWPSPVNAIGSSFRGGGWSLQSDYGKVSHRIYASNTLTDRQKDFGGRGVRTSQP